MSSKFDNQLKIDTENFGKIEKQNMGVFAQPSALKAKNQITLSEKYSYFSVSKTVPNLTVLVNANDSSLLVGSIGSKIEKSLKNTHVYRFLTRGALKKASFNSDSSCILATSDKGDLVLEKIGPNEVKSVNKQTKNTLSLSDEPVEFDWSSSPSNFIAASSKRFFLLVN